MNKRQIKKHTKKKTTQEIEKELRKKTIDELKILLSQALYDEFKDDPEYQRRVSQKCHRYT
jgi:hypothetical protein